MKDNNNTILNETTYLRIDYDNFLLLLELMEAYIEADKEIFSGSTGEKIYKLIPIKEKFNNKYKEALELQKKLQNTLKEYFGDSRVSWSSNFGSDNAEINHYKIDTNFFIELTIEEILVLYYYASIFKEYYNRKLKFSKSYIVISNIDNILKWVQESIMTRVPSAATFYEHNK